MSTGTQAAPARPVAHLLVETQTSAVGAWVLGDALALARTGHPVQVLFIQNGVAAAAAGAGPHAQALADAGGELLVDGFSLAQRGMSGAKLVPAARVVDMAEVAARVLAPGVRVVWH